MPSTYTPHVVSVNGIHSGDAEDDPGAKRYRKRFLAEGDSWFSQGALPSSNLLFELELPYRSFILSLAAPGDEVVRMSEFTTNRLFRAYLTQRRFTWRWDAILLSGGGNDLIADISRIVVPGSGSDPAAYVDRGGLASTLRRILRGYARIVAMRDTAGSVNRNVPVVLHTYDYLTPRHAKALAFGQFPVAGPWLIGRFEQCGVHDAALRDRVCDHLIDVIAQALLSLAQKLPRCVVVDTRGTLKRAAAGTTRASHDWLNEIHPTREGYRKLGRKIASRL